ncbi:MAG: hypothetical protein ACK559_26970, partial [bacterium]
MHLEPEPTGGPRGLARRDPRGRGGSPPGGIVCRSHADRPRARGLPTSPPRRRSRGGHTGPALRAAGRASPAPQAGARGPGLGPRGRGRVKDALDAGGRFAGRADHRAAPRRPGGAGGRPPGAGPALP